jgi:hypothetical protein
MKRRFTVTVTATVEIDQAVFDEIEKDDWRGTFYNIRGKRKARAGV